MYADYLAICDRFSSPPELESNTRAERKLSILPSTASTTHPLTYVRHYPGGESRTLALPVVKSTNVSPGQHHSCRMQAALQFGDSDVIELGG